MQFDCPFPDLIRRAREEDPHAWDQLVTAHRPDVYGLAYRVVGDGQDAEDVCQEVFIRVYRKLSKFRGSTAEDFGRWLRKICVRQCLDVRRKRRRRQQIAREVPWDEPLYAGRWPARQRRPSDVTGDPRSAFDLFRAIMGPVAIERATRLLSPEERAVYWLKVLYGYTHDEIASILEVETRTVVDRFGRARRKLESAPEE